ncbi:YqjF family protein [Vallicoccus soli]|uniref:DUF2071 domain-containing protein n=1 Tax=Vallicoccus soli TaxID=2339232 RepID=A0A3A3ZNJ0_9ACTN|nr:DUF2071 domain-containing protein [Vallicoccus soli]
MGQWWRDLAFVHWAVEPARVRPLMPPGVRPDEHDGATYVGLVPFRMVDAGLLRGPAVPWLGTFLETNVRLYSVDAQGRRGVVFRSLDADRLAVVLGARAAYGLPYCSAAMAFRRDGDEVSYATRRRWPPDRTARNRVRVRVGAPVAEPTPLERFLTARWGLHSRWLGRTTYVPNEHATWDLRRAELLDLDDGLVAAAGLPGVVSRPPDSVLFSDGVRTVFGPPLLG